MNTALFFDTETTGLPLFDQPSEDPRQPHIVQLGACLVDLDTRETVASIDLIVRPSDWTIPDEVAAIHGITTERALRVGVPEALAVELLLDLHRPSGVRIAHNENFDQRIVRIACKRFFDEATVEEWKAGKTACTATMATPVMKLPPTARMRAAGRSNFKTPNLREAFHFFTGQQLDNAHRAMVDVQACMAVFFAMQDAQAAKAAA